MNSKNNIYWQNFVHNLVWLRNHYDFSKEKMAQIMEIDVVLYEKIEKGDGGEELSVEVVYKVYNFFDVHCDEIFTNRFW